MAAALCTLACIEKVKLLQEFARTVAEYHRMQTAQLASILKGEDFQFEREIAEAAAHRENAKYAVLAHQQEHGC